MQRLSFLFFVFFQGANLYAQEVSDVDSLESKPAWNVQVSPYAQWNEVFGRQMAYAGIDAELLLRENIVIGFFGEVMLGTFIKRIVFPNTYEFSNYKYGVSVGYNLPVHEKFIVLSRLKISQQNVTWTEQEGGSFSVSDRSVELRPMAGFNYFFWKGLSVGGMAGYNISNGLDLSGIDNEDMNGMVLTLRIGIKI